MFNEYVHMFVLIYIHLYYHIILFIFVGECPAGVAWADKAYGSNTAHQSVACSNAGVCDYNTGSCKCYSGFTGNACQRSKFQN